MAKEAPRRHYFPELNIDETVYRLCMSENTPIAVMFNIAEKEPHYIFDEQRAPISSIKELIFNGVIELGYNSVHRKSTYTYSLGLKFTNKGRKVLQFAIKHKDLIKMLERRLMESRSTMG